MKNPNIATMLKYYRKLNNLSVKDVVNIFKENNNTVAEKTIYGWESGQTQPNADTLMFLCKLYKIDNILETFGYHNGNTQAHVVLNEFEKNLILNYRKNKEMQPAIKRLLELEDIHISKEKR